jgi:uncharacterized protein (TIGR03067 family)
MLNRATAALIAYLLAGSLVMAQNKPASDDQRIQGTWTWDPAEKQSDAEPRVILERLTIKDDKLTFHYRLGDQRSTSATQFKLDPTATPAAIDFTPTGGANAGRTYLGRYELKGDRLKICYRGPGSTRPKDFTDKAAGNAGTAFIYVKRPPVEA